MLHMQLPRAFIGKSYLHVHDMLLNLVQLSFSAPGQPWPALLKHCRSHQSEQNIPVKAARGSEVS